MNSEALTLAAIIGLALTALGSLSVCVFVVYTLTARHEKITDMFMIREARSLKRLHTAAREAMNPGRPPEDPEAPEARLVGSEGNRLLTRRDR